MTASGAQTQWATVWADAKSGPVSVEALRDLAYNLDEVGALLALRDDVSGVQSFDASSSQTQRPRLRIFTRPDDVGAVQTATAELLADFSIDANLHSELRDDEQWRDTWKRFYRPLVFGDHQLLLRPSWIDRGDSDPVLEVVLDPGRAFGTGLHQSTALCLERLCDLARAGFAPRRVLDLGCGSGVLALAAARLFEHAAVIIAIDNDPEAAETARENAEINQCTQRLDVRCATLSDLRDDEPFDLIIGNIRPVVLIPAAPLLRERTVAGGKAMLSGILREEADRVAAAFLAAGWQVDRTSGGGRRHLETWSGLDWVAP